MRLDRRQADIKAPRNLLVAELGGDKKHHLVLPRGERYCLGDRGFRSGGARPLGNPAQKTCGDSRRADLLAAYDLSEEVRELVERRGTRYVTTNSRFGPGDHIGLGLAER